MERWNFEPTSFNFGETLEPRYEFYSVLYKNYFYLFGGCKKNFNSYTYYNDMFKLNLKTKKWKKVEQKGKIPTVRSSGSFILYKNFL